MSGDYWRDARKHRRQKRDEMTECPRCAYRDAMAGRTPRKQWIGEPCLDCGEVIS